MKKKKEDEKEDDEELPHFRQVIIAGLNESITLISNYDAEDMRYLSSRAMQMYQKIKETKEERKYG